MVLQRLHVPHPDSVRLWQHASVHAVSAHPSNAPGSTPSAARAPGSTTIAARVTSATSAEPSAAAASAEPSAAAASTEPWAATTEPSGAAEPA